MQIKDLKEYTLLREEEIADIGSKGYLLKHNKTNARIMLLENDEENKVFNIAFRTPPSDSTGIAHILEHSVLCGSKNFPLKDPFVELAKGSLNTFLNAMTYPDKTMYPVASLNDQDFQNLMHVYLDAVFYPNIYNKEEIFHQEGWHYHLGSPDDPLTYNGVVYNEMKGAFSSEEEVIDREIFNTLFPDTAYGVESGGDPDFIPDLTYEQFLDFHRKFYHPSNSYIYLYGKIDMAEKLKWLDEEYLSKFEAIDIDSEIKMQKSFGKPVDKLMSYPVSESDSEEDKTYLTYNVVVGDSLDIELNMAFRVIEYALTSAPGAPLRQALLDEKVGKDVTGSYQDGIYQPFFSLIAKYARAEDKEKFLKVIRATLEKLIEDGIDKKSLQAGINYFEFRFREADFSSYPKGLIYGMDVFESWLYDETMPFDYLCQLKVFESLKEKMKGRYFEELIDKYLLNNSHAAIIVAKPEKGLAVKREEQIVQKLQDHKAGLTETEIQKLIKQTMALKDFQEQEESPEALEKIPMLQRSDIKKEAECLYNDERTAGNTKVIFHELDTNGIAYMTLLFDTKDVPEHLVPYMSLLKSVLGYVDTENYTYRELFNEINSNSGGINAGIHVYQNVNQKDSCIGLFTVQSKCLYSQLPFVVGMVKEIISSSKLADEKRLYEIIARQQSRLEGSLQTAGHLTAVGRLASYYSKSGWLEEQISGISFYRLMERLEARFEEEKDDVISKLEELMKIIFRTENMCISYTSDEEGYQLLSTQMDEIESIVSSGKEAAGGEFKVELKQKNEAFMTAGQVQYVAVGGSFKDAGYSYTGTLRVLKPILSYDYLWTNIRVKGGAYGCMSGFRRTGDGFLVSYRDPNLAKTLEVYQNTPDYLRSFKVDERQMTKYIIGTISDVDTPRTPASKGNMSLNAYFCGVTEEDIQKERDEILNATAEDIQKLADIVEAVLKQGNLCVVGSESVIGENREKFLQVEHLIGEH